MYDSHQDTPSQLLRLRDPGIDNNYSQVDFPKLKKGGVDGAFWALYTPPDYDPSQAESYATRLLDAIYAPYMTLSFLALPVIPKLKITDMGLFDSERMEFV